MGALKVEQKNECCCQPQPPQYCLVRDERRKTAEVDGKGGMGGQAIQGMLDSRAQALNGQSCQIEASHWSRSPV